MTDREPSGRKGDTNETVKASHTLMSRPNMPGSFDTGVIDSTHAKRETSGKKSDL